MARYLRKTEQFFMLTPNVRDKLLDANLTAAEWRVWCYLVSLDPFGDRGAKFSPAELMLRCGLKKSTYFATKAKFQKLGLFDFKDGTTKVYNLQSHPVDAEKSDHSQQQQVIESKNLESKSKNLESKSKNLESKSKNLEKQPLEPLQNKTSVTPHTIQTYTDFKQTLSEEERANFLIFCKELTSNLNQPVNDLEAWLASKNKAGQNRWEVYYQKFLAREEEQAKKMTRKTGRQLMNEFHAELEQQQQAIEISNREKEQAIANPQRLEV